MRASRLVGLSTVTASLAVAAARAPAQQAPRGLFQGETDVGQVTQRGSVTYDTVRERYTIAGSGANMWSDRDDFHFVWRRIQGNFLLIARRSSTDRAWSRIASSDGPYVPTSPPVHRTSPLQFTGTGSSRCSSAARPGGRPRRFDPPWRDRTSSSSSARGTATRSRWVASVTARRLYEWPARRTAREAPAVCASGYTRIPR